ncbi:hypothetical protein BDW74DRAFT_177013 [Aspergillus multicolor]|uniref:uncharacterized protein n=1 Tax=Aspergillus multicolor TaxID=41759 RepID=UPI003CCCC0BD
MANSDERAQIDAPVESLPPEVRRRILSMATLGGIKALVHASPVYYQQFRLDRQLLIRDPLVRTLGPIFIDAYTVYRSGTVDLRETRTSHTITSMRELYRCHQFEANHFKLSELCTKDDITGILRFHLLIVAPIARRYSQWALGNLAKEEGASSIIRPTSEVEEMRILRALYRFQLCCNLYSAHCHESPRQVSPEFNLLEVLNLCIALLEPWEAEEICCINTFFKEKYHQIFQDIGPEVNHNNLNNIVQDQRGGIFQLAAPSTRDIHAYVPGMISHGLPLLHTIFYRIENRANLVSTIEEHMRPPPSGIFVEKEWGDAMNDDAHFGRLSEGLYIRDLKQNRCDPLLFQGDRIPDSTGTHPPLAWILMWKGTYSNLFGGFIDDTFRRWGYVMWDAERIQSTGAEEVLKRQYQLLLVTKALLLAFRHTTVALRD